jgi:hypothetical protein
MSNVLLELEFASVQSLKITSNIWQNIEDMTDVVDEG